MPEPKPLASLTGGLLARKGAAKPAMRRPAFAVHGNNAAVMDDLGWDDMGYDVDPHQSDDNVIPTGASLRPRSISVLSNSVPDAGALSHAEPHEDDIVSDGVSQPVPQTEEAPVAFSSEAAEATPEAAPPIVEASDVRPSIPEVIRQRELLAQKMKPQALDAQSESPRAEPVTELGLTASPRTPMEARTLIEQSASVDQSAPVEAPMRGQILARTPRMPRPAPAPRSKAAFTLRIDPDRHLRLRLASAVTRRSAQVILIEALDKYLKSLPEIDALAHQVPQPK